MNKLVITKNKVYFAVMFLIIYCSHDTLMFGTNTNNLFITVRKIIPFLLCAVLLLMDLVERRRYSSKHLLWGIFVIILPLLSCIANNEAWDNYIYRLAIMLCAFLLALSNDHEKICEDYCAIMAFLSLWSIGVFVITSVWPWLVSMAPSIVNTNGYSYANLLFSVVEKSSNVRNYGLFREPGVYVVFLTIAFLFEIVKGNSKKRTKRIFIFTVAMLTTVSTAGYIILAAIFIYLVSFNRDIKHKPLIVITICGAVLILATQTNLLLADGAMFSKFSIGSNSYGSWFARLSSLTENLKIAINNPFWGIGRYSLYTVVLAQNGVYAAVDNTNTIMIGFAAYGIPFGIMLIMGCWKYFRKKTDNIIFAVFLFMILFMSLSNEDMGQNVIFYYIVFAGFYERDRRAYI